VTAYVIRRFFQSLLFIAAGALLVYTAIVTLMPTGPGWRFWRMQEEFRKLEPDFPGLFHSPETDAFARQYKVDQPWPLSFFLWLFDPRETGVTTTLDGQEVSRGIDVNILGVHIKGSGILTGDFGRSRWAGRGSSGSVSQLMAEKAGNTVLLVTVALALSVLIAIPLGAIGAIRHGTGTGHVLTFVSFAARSVPPFALGSLFILFLAVIPYQLHHQNGLDWMPYLPTGETVDTGQEGNWLNRMYHLILPAATLATIQVVWLSRYVRASMLDVLNQDYIRTARAKGLSRRSVVYKHALRNALIPLITVFGLALPGLVAGAIIIEQIFGYEGLGQLYYRSLGGSLTSVGAGGLGRDEIPPIGGPIDYPLALVMTIMLIAVVAFSNMLADVMYAVADPRVNYSKKS
jgi:peptide/nickel transport system permease protein